MRILLGCEESGIVRDEFTKLGHDAWSCDFLPSRRPGKHIQADILTVLNDGWDMAIFFTPCTYLSNSGVHWLNRRPERWELMERDARLFKACMDAKIPKIANENPIPHKYALAIIGRKYDQIIQPHWFGDDASKQTCLWLKNLDPLQPTKYIEPRWVCCGAVLPKGVGKYGCPNCEGDNKPLPRWGNQTNSGQNKLTPSETRQRDRSETFPGIAKAMAQQWSKNK